MLTSEGCDVLIVRRTTAAEIEIVVEREDAPRRKRVLLSAGEARRLAVALGRLGFDSKGE